MLYLVRMVLLLSWALIASLISLFRCFARPFDPDNSYLFGHLFASIGLKILNVQFITKNQESMDAQRPCIFISNHQHNLDMLSCCHILPKKTVSLGKKDLKLIPIWGQLYWLGGNILIDRFHRGRAMRSMDQVKQAIAEKGVSVWIMPEGTRNKNNELRKFKKGAFVTAINAQVPIVPVAYSSYKKYLNFNRWKGGVILAEVLPAIPTTGLTLDKAEALAQQCHKLIKSKIEQLDAQADHFLAAGR